MTSFVRKRRFYANTVPALLHLQPQRLLDGRRPPAERFATRSGKFADYILLPARRQSHGHGRPGDVRCPSGWKWTRVPGDVRGSMAEAMTVEIKRCFF